MKKIGNKLKMEEKTEFIIYKLSILFILKLDNIWKIISSYIHVTKQNNLT